MSQSHCPDCGEPLQIRRGVLPMMGTAYCVSCLWCEVADGKRGETPIEDWMNKNIQPTENIIYNIGYDND